MPERDERFLIVGAGPTGLAAALFMSEAGLRPRVIEQRTEPSKRSKAFGVNARTLELLEASGVTGRLLAQGHQLRFANLWRHGRRIARIGFDGAHPRYPFILIHAQSRTERLLEETLAGRGIEVERGRTLLKLDAAPDRVVAEVEGEGRRERFEVDRLVGADGAHGRVREAAGIAFDGDAYDEAWQLYDLELDLPLERDEGHVFLLDDGGMFVVRLEAEIWRVIGRPHDLLDRLPAGTRIGEVVWESAFHIAHRITERIGDGRISLAGDAAHLHSPVGGRGMNLGIEDAWVWARLAAERRLGDYDRLRRPVDRKLVRQIARLTELPRGLSPTSRAMRALLPCLGPLIPLVRARFARWILGLDHEVRLR